jgi:hypothetical protein
MGPPTKLQVFANFLPQKMLQPLSPPCSPDLSQPDYFLFSKLKMKIKGLHLAGVAEIQKAVTDELKKVQKEKFSAAFQNCMTAQKPAYMPIELILNLKKVCVFLMCLRFLKKSVLKLLDRTVHVRLN